MNGNADWITATRSILARFRMGQNTKTIADATRQPEHEVERRLHQAMDESHSAVAQPQPER